MARATEDQSRAIALLGDPATHGGETPSRVDTHGAMVFLTRDRVYKLKRAVRYSFMDFSTAALRQAACEAEVRLNRRVAPEIYLGVAPILDTPDGLLLGKIDDPGAGRLDSVVVMRRFEGTLAEGPIADGDLIGLAERIAAFHEAEPPIAGLPGAARVRAIQEGNIDDLSKEAACPPATLARLADRARPMLSAVSRRLEARADAGAVRHCHGDLHLGNVCRWRGEPVLFDRIEFNDEFARIDTLYDLAFLLMDLDGHGRRDGAARVLNRYLERRPEEVDGLDLLPLFQSMRAQVRAKVAFAAASFDAPARAEARRLEALDYLERAIAYLDPARPTLLAVGGPSGSGKSTLAVRLAADIGAPPGAVVFRADAVRKRLFGAEDDTARLPSDAYTKAASVATYGEMERLCGLALDRGRAVIADATFLNPDSRARVEALARDRGVPFDGVWLSLDQDAAAERVRARTGDISDATPSVVEGQFLEDWGDVRWTEIDGRLGIETIRDRIASTLISAPGTEC
jgi:aminoglycoside phosphotransferase family enzyme/predicted kinase